jgi:hypothetical protein
MMLEAQHSDHAVPAPLEFAVEALSARGALVERDTAGAFAILPEPLAGELGLREEVRLEEAQCGFGSALLEQLTSAVRARPAIACATCRVGPGRAGQARALAEKLVPRNAVADVLDVSAGEGTYAAIWIAFEAEADDRHAGLVSVLIAADDGSQPDDVLFPLFDPSRGASHLEELRTFEPLSKTTLSCAAVRLRQEIERECGSFLEGVARRHRRDHERTYDYFRDLIAETQSPRRKLDPESIRAKVAHIDRERDAKLLDLRGRYAASITAKLAACVVLRMPESSARVRIRRRKESKELRLRVPSGARTSSMLACDACGSATARPAFCDDALHVLCEVCLPNAQGRPSCAACRQAR